VAQVYKTNVYVLNKVSLMLRADRLDNKITSKELWMYEHTEDGKQLRHQLLVEMFEV
jgi:hypothetical protein